MTARYVSEEGPCAWLWRPSLSRRIALAMVLSLFAIQAQAFLQIWMLSKPELRLTGTRWLSEQTQDLARETFAIASDQRMEFLLERSRETGLTLGWHQTLPWTSPDESNTPLASRLAATLRDVLGDGVLSVYISASTATFMFPNRQVHFVIAPEQVVKRVRATPVREGEAEVLIPAGVKVAVQGKDGTWLGIELVAFEDGAFGSSLPLTPLLVGGLIIAAVSTLTARRMMAPLDRLVTAAERVGAAREPVHVAREGLFEFSSVARAFEEMQLRLLKFVEDRTQMLAAISHDLRSSLTRLRLAAEDCPDEPVRTTLTKEIEDMQAMLDSTLAFASGEARLTPNQVVDFASLLISLVDETADTGHDCSYEGPDHLEANGHPVSLKRAFRNVIDNALKYGKRAHVSLTSTDAKLIIRIDDEGPGIPAARIDEAFAPFRRLDAARGGEVPGAGLGLTIARDVIQSHGGVISLANRSSGGLTVEIELPRP